MMEIFMFCQGLYVTRLVLLRISFQRDVASIPIIFCSAKISIWYSHKMANKEIINLSIRFNLIDDDSPSNI